MDPRSHKPKANTVHFIDFQAEIQAIASFILFFLLFAHSSQAFEAFGLTLFLALQDLPHKIQSSVGS